MKDNNKEDITGTRGADPGILFKGCVRYGMAWGLGPLVGGEASEF